MSLSLASHSGEWIIKDKLGEQNRLVVLVVEDKPMIRMFTAEVLENDGCEVVEAASAPVALNLLEKRADVTALLTDIDMYGGMDGLETATLVHERWSHITLLVTSGVIPAGGP
jgi:CheY-like chemotaxis protein